MGHSWVAVEKDKRSLSEGFFFAVDRSPEILYHALHGLPASG